MEKILSLATDILDFIFETAKLLPLPLETPYAHIRRIRRLAPGKFHHSVWQLKRAGMVKVYKKQNKKFVKLTKKGQLKILMAKAKLPRPPKWDGKWRLVMYDIPESSKLLRNQMRKLLRQAEFKRLQASVYVSAWPLNRQAINYLSESGLIEYVRIFRVDECDNEKKLRTMFKLRWQDKI